MWLGGDEGEMRHVFILPDDDSVTNLSKNELVQQRVMAAISSLEPE